MKYSEKKTDLSEVGKEVQEFWNEEKIFEKSVDTREGKPAFTFYEGPPSANGTPGIHHVMGRTVKDIFCRFKTMEGFQVKRKGGWDTHGLPVELQVEKELGITKDDIGKTISVETYNQACRAAVMKYKSQWDDLTVKMGYWVDLDKPYVTFENDYIETLWWCLNELYKKGYLYESVSIQPYSPAAGTGLSSHELNQPGTYKDVKDTSVVAMFKMAPHKKELINMSSSMSLATAMASSGRKTFYEGLTKIAAEAGSSEVFFLAWTTTPWTLPSNLGLTVGPKIQYLLVKTINPYNYFEINVILAKSLFNKFFETDLVSSELKTGDFRQIIKGPPIENPKEYFEKGKVKHWKILAEFKGEEIEGTEYEQLMSFDANSIEEIELQTLNAKPFRVILGDFVTTEDGTGIVHTSPAFGADDYKVGQKNNLGILTLVDKQGKFVEGVGEFSGRYVKDYKNEADYADVNIDISVKLKKENRAFKVEKYEHTYPHCWRTDKPIIYYPLDAWFIKTTAVKDRMVELNKTINWKPASTGTGRFGNWLENMVDWNLSRSRFWGTPLPIWKTADGEQQKCIGTIHELNNEIRKAAEVLGGDTNTHY
ncbi:MAG: class I tRNA ligase family protein, partial [Cytophagales bacterium]|nr:class I tRNA ligase family protein [Cytophaga sp.]